MPVDAFIKIGNLKGESKDSDHNDGWIDVTSYSLSMNAFAQVAGGGLSAAKGTISDFHFTKNCDSSSTDMAKQLMTGVHHDTATFHVRKAGGDAKNMVYFEIEFKKVYITSISFGGSGSEPGTFTESVSFAFKEYKATYTQQEETGATGLTSGYGYDIGAGREV